MRRSVPPPTQRSSHRRRRGPEELLVVALVAGCRGGPAAPAPEPKLWVDSESLDAGGAEHGSPLEFRIRVSNQGSAPLHLERIASSGECRGHDLPRTLSSGQPDELRVRCDSVLHGPFRASLALYSDDARSPHALAVSGEVLPRLKLESATVDIDTDFGVEARRELSVSGTRWKDARLKLKALEARDLTAEVVPGVEEQPPRLRLVLGGRQAGTQVGQVVLTTGLADPPELSLHYRTQVRGTLSVDPARPYLNLRFAADRSRVLRVSSPQPGFRVLAATILEGPFTTRVLGKSRDREGSYDVAIGVDTAQLSTETRGATGRLRLRTNDRSEPERDVPLVALGKLGAADPVKPGGSAGEAQGLR